MVSTALVNDFEYLKDFGFSDQQVKGLSRLSQKQKENLLHITQEQEKKMVTKDYLELQISKLKVHFLLQGVALLLSGMVLLGWFIDHLDNKTRAYVDAHFKHIDDRFDAQDKRFDKIESELKDIKNFIFSQSSIKKP